MTHTPTTWKVSTINKLGIEDASGYNVAHTTFSSFDDRTSEANAAHIVKCVNLHDELVEALLPIAKMEIILDSPDDEDICFVSYGTIKKIKETLKKAGAL